MLSRETKIQMACAFLLFVLALLGRQIENPLQPLLPRNEKEKTWYLEINHPKLKGDAAKFLLTPGITEEITHFEHMDRIFTAHYDGRSVIAFLTDIDANEEQIESNVRFLMGQKISEQRTSEFSYLLFRKPVAAPLRGVQMIDARFGVQDEPEIIFENEIMQLFGERNLYRPDRGFVPLLNADFQLEVAMKSKDESLQTQQEAWHEVRRRLASISGIEMVFVRNLPVRMTDLLYDGVTMNHLGINDAQLHSVLNLQRLENRLSSLSLGKQSYPVILEEKQEKHSILPLTLKEEGLERLGLEHISQERLLRAKMSGVLGSRVMHTWNLQLRPDLPDTMEEEHKLSGRALSGKGSHEHGQSNQIELSILAKHSVPLAVLESNLKSHMDSLRKELPNLILRLRGMNTRKANNGDFSSEILLIISSIAYLLARIFPVSAPGSILLRCTSFSFFLFAIVSFAFKLTYSDLHLLSVASFLFFYGISAQMPIAKESFLQSSRHIRSQDIHIFLFIITLLFVMTVLYFESKLSFSASKHLLAILIASFANFMAGTLQNLASHSCKLYIEEEIHHTSSMVKGFLCLLFIASAFSFQELVRIDPPGVLVKAHVQVQSRGSNAQELESKLAAHITGIRDLGFQRQEILKGEDSLSLEISPAPGARDLPSFQVIDGMIRSTEAQVMIHPDSLFSEPQAYRVRNASLLEGSPGPHQMRLNLESYLKTISSLGDESQKVPMQNLLEANLVRKRAKDVVWDKQHNFSIMGFSSETNPRTSRERADSAEQSIKELAHSLEISSGSLETSNSIYELDREFQKTERLIWISALMALLSGALFFGSLRGAIQSLLTFFVVYGITAPTQQMIVSLAGRAMLISPLELQIANLCMSFALLTVWAQIAGDTNDSRRANLTLNKALSPIFTESRRTCQVLLVLFIFSFIVSLSFHEVKFIAGVLMIAYLSLLLFPGWTYFWSVCEEAFNRQTLRLIVRIHPKISRLSLGIVVYISMFGICFKETSHAKIIDTSCNRQAFVVLPIVKKPQSVENTALNTEVTELLSSQLPCVLRPQKWSKQLLEIARKHPGSENSEEATRAFKAFLGLHYTEIAHEAEKNLAQFDRPDMKVSLIAGFTEELFGHTGLVFILKEADHDPVSHKFTERNSDVVDFMSRFSETLRGDDLSFLESLEKDSLIIPVKLERVSSQVREDSRKARQLRFELQNFIESRLRHPLQLGLLERRDFFRLARDDEETHLTLRVTFASEGSKLFAAVQAQAGGEQRTAWISNDLTGLTNFQSDVLRSSRQVLASLEGIRDYSLTVGPGILATQHRVQSMPALRFRQNRGLVAIGGKLQVGTIRGFEAQESPQLLILPGAYLGFQPMDLRWLTLDFGLTLSAGIAQRETLPSNSEAENTEPHLFGTGGGYAQVTLTSPGGWVAQAEVSTEVPYEAEITSPSGGGKVLPTLFTTFLGVGYAF